MLGYQPRARRALVLARRLPVYRPWALFGWWYHYEAYAPRGLRPGGRACRRQRLPRAARAAIVGLAVAGAPGAARHDLRLGALGDERGDRARRPARRRRASSSAASTAHYLRHDGPEHVMAFAPTRTGKGVGLVVPTLLTWTGSAVIHDIKGENWQLTAGWRVALLALPAVQSDRPALGRATTRCSRCAAAPHEVRDVQNIADILVDPGRRARAAQPLGEDQPLAAGRRDPARALRRGGQDARAASPPSSPIPRGRSSATLRADDDHQPSRHRASRRSIRSSPRPRASSSTSRENERSGVLSTAMSLPRPLPRPDRRRGDRRAATGASPTWSRPSSRSRSIWSCRRPTSAAPSRWSG